MNILVLGGTGAMGVPLVELLSQKGDNVYVTTRSQKKNHDNVTYLCGNAKEQTFFENLMKRKYDAIVYFMVYGTEVLHQRLKFML